MTFTVRLILLILLQAACLCPAASEPALAQMRQDFLQAEQYLYRGRDDAYFTLAGTLKNYPLYPYLQYERLKLHLNEDKPIIAYLQAYPQSRYAQLLRQKWLLELGKNQQWSSFIEYYHHNDDAELHCFYAQAQYQTGQQATALDSARQLWLSGKNQPAACEALFTLLLNAPSFNPEWVWGRFQAALALDNTRLAQQVAALLPKPRQADADLWLKLHNRPQTVTADAEWKHSYPQAGPLFAHAIGQWLDSEPAAALHAWDSEKANFAIPPAIAADTEKRLAMALAFKHDKLAFERLTQLAEKDDASREWAVRAALSQQNWLQAGMALDELTEEQKQQDKWQYWQARVLAVAGQTVQAAEIYQKIAKNRSYYGFLAADRLQQDITLTDRPLEITAQEIQQMQATDDFQIVAELLALHRNLEAKRQWRHAIASLDQHRLAIAAKLAQQWQLPSLAIATVAKANAWDDIDLRFPMQHTVQIENLAASQQLDPAIIFGLIRQESAFDEFAESSAGAKGLLQVLPSTAQQIAQNFHEGWQGEDSLFNPDLNLKYGSFYYKKLLRQFHGAHLLAAAAYNAGAAKIKRWLPENQALPGDIWVESIPYKETRNYVSAVFMNALIYQQRLHRSALKLADLLPEVRAN